MDLLKKLFPFSFKAADVKELVIAIIIYLVIGLVVGIVCALLGIIPLVGALIGSILGSVVGLYDLIGIVLAVLVFAKVLN